MMRIALITIAHGRHDHLTRQYEALAASSTLPDDIVLVAIDDPDIGALRFAGIQPRVVEVARGFHGLPLAAARNFGAAVAAGADLLIFLDVDCLPSASLIEAYASAALDPRWSDRLLCGPVAYLPPPPDSGYDLADVEHLAAPHPARPAPPPGTVVADSDSRLFWSLSFAVTSDVWRRIGGFYEAYEGYGAEDTDFATMASAAGIELAWVGGARAFHQHHPTASPPVQHLDDIVRNAQIFFDRWGRWPMEGWLEDFEREGLIVWEPATIRAR